MDSNDDKVLAEEEPVFPYLRPGFYFATWVGIERRLGVEVGYNGKQEKEFPRVFVPGFPDSYPIDGFRDFVGPLKELKAPNVRVRYRKGMLVNRCKKRRT